MPWGKNSQIWILFSVKSLTQVGFSKREVPLLGREAALLETTSQTPFSGHTKPPTEQGENTVFFF